MTAEHPCAIALQAGRPEDFTRLLAFVESEAFQNFPRSRPREWAGRRSPRGGRRGGREGAQEFEVGRHGVPSLPPIFFAASAYGVTVMPVAVEISTFAVPLPVMVLPVAAEPSQAPVA